jgi:hypothetical protein
VSKFLFFFLLLIDDSKSQQPKYGNNNNWKTFIFLFEPENIFNQNLQLSFAHNLFLILTKEEQKKYICYLQGKKIIIPKLNSS